MYESEWRYGMMLNNKISFIVVRSKENNIDDLFNDLSKMIIPAGFSAELLEIFSDETAMEMYKNINKLTQAKYKVYINGNMRINNQHFIEDMLELFINNKDIAAAGGVGSPIVTVDGRYKIDHKRSGNLYYLDNELKHWFGNDDIIDAKIIEKYIFATQYDIEWQYDDFQCDEYLYSAQCVDYRKKGYRTVLYKKLSVGLIYNGKYNDAYNDKDREYFIDRYYKDIFPLVNVLIPTYNRPEYFEIALKSALAQDYKNIEIIVSDASENDATEKLMQEKYPDIIYHHKSGGNNWTWLTNHINPEAEYINWLMDDDLFYPQKISAMIDYFLQCDDVTLVTSVRDLIDENGNKLPDTFNRPMCEKSGRLLGHDVGKAIFMNTENFIGEPTTALIKKASLEHEYGWGSIMKKPECLVLGDLGTWLELMSKGNLGYIVERLSAFRQHTGNNSNNNSTLIYSTINWAMYIKHAWDNMIFIDDEKTYRKLLRIWLDVAVKRINEIELCGYKHESVELLKDVYIKVAYAIINGGKINVE